MHGTWDVRLLTELGLTLRWVLETHVHADHVTGSSALRERLGGQSVVSSRSGEVEYNEFLAATLSTQKKLDKPSIKTAFQTLDRDGNGYVDVNDLKAILGKDKAYTEKELAEIVEHTGYAHDGKLYFADFMKLMVKGAKQGQEHALFRMTGSLADLGSASLSESGK